MIVYIAGKIKGCKDYEARFRLAEEKLKKEGHIVLSPAVLPKGMPIDRYLPICFAMIDQADAVYVLENWMFSEGAKIEQKYAKYQGKKVMF